MSKKITLSLLTLPIELVYRILDNLDEFTILVSIRDVCSRLNAKKSTSLILLVGFRIKNLTRYYFEFW